jgi:hypothetical protein
MATGQSDRDAGLLNHLVEFLMLYASPAKSEFAAYTIPMTSLVVALRQVLDMPFVAPIDVLTGATTDPNRR